MRRFDALIQRLRYAKRDAERNVLRSLHAQGFWRRSLSRRLRKAAARRDGRLRVVLGGGPKLAYSGWYLTDIDILNVLDEAQWQSIFGTRRVDALLAEHVWEHLTWNQGVAAAAIAFKFLRPGGSLRIAVPDGLYPDEKYLATVQPGGTGKAAKDHKELFTWPKAKVMFESAGFTVSPLEYWDEQGVFHHLPWSIAGGRINRRPSLPTDSPAWTGSLAELCRLVQDINRRPDAKGSGPYTSLIIDATKPAQ